jgi:iron complex outermembrane receptor protein
VQRIGAIPVPDNPIRELRQTSAYAQLLWRRALSPSSDLQLRYSYVNERSDDAFSVRLPAPLPSLSFSVNQSGDEGQRNELELQHSFQPGDAMRLVWGASWREDGTRSAWALPGLGMVNREVSRLFGNLEWKPLMWFTGNIGLAGENDSLAGFHALPRISTNFHLNAENTIRFGYSRAYRTGSTVDYLGNEKISIPPVYSQTVFTGTPNLPAERLDTFEIGYLGDWRAWRSSLDVRLYSERIPNRQYRIDIGNGKSTIPIQDVHISGVEYQFKWQPFEMTRLILGQAFAKSDSEYLASALALSGSELLNPGRNQDITNFTENSMPRRSTSILLMQKLPWGLEFSTAGYWQGKMKWSTTTESQKYHRVDARLGYPFRAGTWGGEIAFVVQSLNGAHGEYKASGNSRPDDRVVERRQWVSLRLDF